MERKLSKKNWRKKPAAVIQFPPHVKKKLNHVFFVLTVHFCGESKPSFVKINVK